METGIFLSRPHVFFPKLNEKITCVHESMLADVWCVCVRVHVVIHHAMVCCRYSGVFPSLNMAVKRREQALQDYKRLQSKVEKYEEKEKTGPVMVKLHQVQYNESVHQCTCWSTSLLHVSREGQSSLALTCCSQCE